ncbi:hypothetical protein BM1_07771 [Bipolaris maydis]|nr:hypothetical protein BM1_07771 [Bipolaris maydis]
MTPPPKFVIGVAYRSKILSSPVFALDTKRVRRTRASPTRRRVHDKGKPETSRRLDQNHNLGRYNRLVSAS